jgi:hypothetical protein
MARVSQGSMASFLGDANMQGKKEGSGQGDGLGWVSEKQREKRDEVGLTKIQTKHQPRFENLEDI